MGPKHDKKGPPYSSLSLSLSHTHTHAHAHTHTHTRTYTHIHTHTHELSLSLSLSSLYHFSGVPTSLVGSLKQVESKFDIVDVFMLHHVFYSDSFAFILLYALLCCLVMAYFILPCSFLIKFLWSYFSSFIIINLFIQTHNVFECIALSLIITDV
jgi:hypothetical protein